MNLHGKCSKIRAVVLDVDGVLTGAGLILLDGDYYYVKTSNCEVVHGRSYWVTVTNDLLPAGPYTFGADGKMVR